MKKYVLSFVFISIFGSIHAQNRSSSETQTDSKFTFGITGSTYPFFKQYMVGGELGAIVDDKMHYFLGLESGKVSKLFVGFTGKLFKNEKESKKSFSPILGLEAGYEFPLSVIDQHLIKNSVGKEERMLFLQLVGGVEYEFKNFLFEVKTGFGFGVDPRYNIHEARWRIAETGIGIHYMFGN